MVAKGRGSGKTPKRIVELLHEEVKKSSQVVVANSIGLTRLSLQRYLKGGSEPSIETLSKLANYFQVSVAYLLEEYTDNDELGWYCQQFGELLELTTEQEKTLRSTGMIEDEYDAVSIGCLEKCLAEASRLLSLPEEESKRYDSRLLQASKVLASLLLKRFALAENAKP